MTWRDNVMLYNILSEIKVFDRNSKDSNGYDEQPYDGIGGSKSYCYKK